MNKPPGHAALPPSVQRYLQGPTLQDRQFDFLLGDWQVQGTRFGPDGQPLASFAAAWQARHLNGGRMLMDDFQALSPDGTPVSSFVTLRTYSTESERWEMAGLAAMQPAGPMTWHGRWVDGEMRIQAVGADPGGQTVHTRICFFDIGLSGFRWRSESSRDGRDPWTLNVALVAVRRQMPA